MKITSLQNAAIKNIVKLAKVRTQEQQLFVIEGARELLLALAGGISLIGLCVHRLCQE